MCCLFETDDCSLQYFIREWEDSKRDNTRTRVDYSSPSLSITLCYMVLFVTWRFRTKRVLICMIVLSLLEPPRTNVSLFCRCRSHNAAKQFCCCFRHVLWKTAIICTFLQRTIVETKVLHAILCDDPRVCPIKFFAYFRIYIDSFDELLLSTKPLLTHICVYKNTTFRLVIPPEKSSSSGVIRIHI